MVATAGVRRVEQSPAKVFLRKTGMARSWSGWAAGCRQAAGRASFPASASSPHLDKPTARGSGAQEKPQSPEQNPRTPATLKIAGKRGGYVGVMAMTNQDPTSQNTNTQPQRASP